MELQIGVRDEAPLYKTLVLMVVFTMSRILCLKLEFIVLRGKVAGGRLRDRNISRHGTELVAHG